MRDLRGQPGFHVVAEAVEDRGVEHARGDGADPDRPLREVARRVEGHAHDAGLRRGIGELADLPLPRGDRGGKDEHAAVSVDHVVAGHRRRGEPQHVVGADDVHPQHGLEQLQRAGAAVLLQDADRAAAARAVHDGPQRDALGRDLHGGGHRVGVGHVRRGEGRGAAELGGPLRARGRGQVDDHHLAAALGQPLGGGPAEAGRAPGHQHGGSAQVHQEVPFRRRGISRGARGSARSPCPRPHTWSADRTGRRSSPAG